MPSCTPRSGAFTLVLSRPIVLVNSMLASCPTAVPAALSPFPPGVDRHGRRPATAGLSLGDGGMLYLR